jgi:hypothetical protein
MENLICLTLTRRDDGGNCVGRDGNRGIYLRRLAGISKSGVYGSMNCGSRCGCNCRQLFWKIKTLTQFLVVGFWGGKYGRPFNPIAIHMFPHSTKQTTSQNVDGIAVTVDNGVLFKRRYNVNLGWMRAANEKIGKAKSVSPQFLVKLNSSAKDHRMEKTIRSGVAIDETNNSMNNTIICTAWNTISYY